MRSFVCNHHVGNPIVNKFRLSIPTQLRIYFFAMANNSNETSSAPQKAADAVFVPTQEHGFNNKVQGRSMISRKVIRRKCLSLYNYTLYFPRKTSFCAIVCLHVILLTIFIYKTKINYVNFFF